MSKSRKDEPEYAAIAHMQRGLMSVYVRTDMPPRNVRRVVGGKRRQVVERFCVVKVARYGYCRGQGLWIDIRMLETPQAPRKRGAAERRRDAARKGRFLAQSGSVKLAQGATATGTGTPVPTTATATSGLTYVERMALEGVTGDGGELGK